MSTTDIDKLRLAPRIAEPRSVQECEEVIDLVGKCFMLLKEKGEVDAANKIALIGDALLWAVGRPSVFGEELIEMRKLRFEFLPEVSEKAN